MNSMNQETEQAECEKPMKQSVQSNRATNQQSENNY